MSGTEGTHPATTKSRHAFHVLLDLLGELDARFLGPEWKTERPQDIADGHRYILHLLYQALDFLFEGDPERPVFRRNQSPNMKVLGDCSDAIFHRVCVRPDRTYRIRGNMAGAVFVSISQYTGSTTGVMRVTSSIDDTALGIGPDGSFDIVLGPTERPGRWFKLDPDADSLSIRHYFEEANCVAADPTKVIPLSIEPLDPPGPRPAPDDASIAAGIQRVASYVRGITLAQPPFMQAGKVPSWVSTTPNQFNPPEPPRPDIGWANLAAVYAQAPYALGPDEALVMEGRFPKCRCANVNLWNRYMQTYDYVTRTVSLNRKQTTLEADGHFRMVLAHRNPGVPNWLDTGGRHDGIIFWRFLLVEEPVAPLRTQVVPISELRKR
ncbi:MAG: hypothetical protein H6Q33_1416 [Deltaproteobacteria bacterium]|nr:hypothetical protein [Deltaproteobacteria bacterium]